MMKALKIIILSIAILLPTSAFSGETGALWISLIEGDAYLYTEDEGDWLEASVNMPLAEGDTLWVSEGGRAELHFMGSGYLRLDEETMLDVLTVDDDTAEFSLTEGRLYMNADNDRSAPLLVQTPTASARVREAVAMVDVSEAGASRISVLEGRIEAETEGRTKWLYAGESMYVDTDRYASISSRRSAPDEWERWNRWRDDDLAGSYASTRHLPRELHGYARDFDREGRWRYVREYGYVWIPTVSISVGWAPYKHGRWSLRRGSYVWVSYEPWGWAPYHYGRWAFVSRIGWCWVPPRRGEVYWGPGYVAWVYQPTYVAWVPLAPGEIYYGYGYYGPGSVNIVNININKTVINFKYKNVRIRNAVTAVVRDAFIKGKRVAFRLQQNPFLTERPHVGPPRERHKNHEDKSYAGKFRDRRRPPVYGKHKPKERWRPGKPIVFKGVSVKRDAPRVETKKRRKTVPDRGRPPVSAGKHRTKELWKPEPVRAHDPSVKRDAPRVETPKRKKTVPSVQHSVKRPRAVGKERRPLAKKDAPMKKNPSRREVRPERFEARGKAPDAVRTPAPIIKKTAKKPSMAKANPAPGGKAASRSKHVVTERKPPKAEAESAPKGKNRRGKAPASGDLYPGKRGAEAGTAKGNGSKTPNVTGSRPADGGLAGKLFRFSGRGARTGKFR